MTVVLLICLGAFALLMRQSEERVMAELAETVSTVGQATLGAIRVEGKDFAAAEAPPTFVAAPQRRTVEIIERVVDGESQTEVIVISEDASGLKTRLAGGSELLDSLRQCAIAIEPLVEITEGQEEELLSLFVHRISTESDSTGLVMRIPARRSRPRVIAWKADPLNLVAARADSSASELLRLAAIESTDALREIRVAFSTDQYKELFQSTQRRLALVFALVLVVGFALFVWLARRFTQPIRAMDQAIDALSHGDLDARVEPLGNDELARLGGAFNRMAAALRANRERERSLVQRERLSALGRLAAGVAHDVRNPIHSMALTVGHLEDSCRPLAAESQAEFDRSLEILREEIDRVDGLVSTFLRYARSAKFERQPLDLAQLVREVMALIRKEADQARVQVSIVAEDPLPTVPANADRLRSSLLNLAFNAIEAMPEGGALRFELKQVGNELALEIRDTGCGIAAEDQTRIFEFGWSGREEGHGMGLAIVHQAIVEGHGGRLEVESQPGQGSSFRVYLPLSTPAAEEKP